ncbi:hypothetical protein PALB_37840 [Pseudoalteromonas luteoviolacea B = ATCC 29581]|nr:hypothetical protein PALB_37840 [Pseudoalteromonas luteoviolacea B = ATCC 29581]
MKGVLVYLLGIVISFASFNIYGTSPLHSIKQLSLSSLPHIDLIPKNRFAAFSHVLVDANKAVAWDDYHVSTFSFVNNKIELLSVQTRNNGVHVSSQNSFLTNKGKTLLTIRIIDGQTVLNRAQWTGKHWSPLNELQLGKTGSRSQRFTLTPSKRHLIWHLGNSTKVYQLDHGDRPLFIGETEGNSLANVINVQFDETKKHLFLSYQPLHTKNNTILELWELEPTTRVFTMRKSLFDSEYVYRANLNIIINFFSDNVFLIYNNKLHEIDTQLKGSSMQVKRAYRLHYSGKMTQIGGRLYQDTWEGLTELQIVDGSLMSRKIDAPFSLDTTLISESIVWQFRDTVAAGLLNHQNNSLKHIALFKPAKLTTAQLSHSEQRNNQ